MLDIIHTEKRNGYTINIMPDDTPDNPRDWDNIGTLVGAHRRMNIFDTELDARTGNLWLDFLYHIWEEVEQRDGYLDDLTEKQLERFSNSVKRRYVSFPYSAYTKGGCRLTRGVSSGWDSGLVGISYVSRERMREQGLRTYKQAEAAMEAELKTFSQYCNGEVYRFEVLKNDELVNACGGYFGEEHALAEARQSTL